MARYKEKMEEQETYSQTQQETLRKYFQREKLILITEQKKRDEETSTIMQEKQLQFQVC